MDSFGKEDVSKLRNTLSLLQCHYIPLISSLQFSSSNPSLVAISAAAAALRIESESTLSNITSLQSQSQSLYDSDINNQHLLISNQHNSRMALDDEHHVVVVHNNNNASSHKPLHKKSSMPSSSQQQSTTGGGGGGGGSTTIDSFDGIIAPPNSLVGDLINSSAGAGGVGAAIGTATTANTANVVNSNKTATILVSKTKTKTGLPLLLKNSIKN